MEKDKSPNQIGNSLLPPSGRYSLFSPPGIGINVKPEHSAGLTLPPLGPGATSESSLFSHGMSSDSSLFSHDISRMTDSPMKKSGHRRAHSEILTLPDDISFGSDLGVVGGVDGPSLSDEAEDDLLSLYLDMDFNSISATSSFELGGPSSSAPSDSTPAPADKPAPLSSERTRVRHQHSQSLDGSTSIKQLMGSGAEETSTADARKATSAAKLSELAITDPKRAKRVWANRQSAARSKERKMRYISELERKVQAMQTEATSLSAQLALLQRDTNGLTAENSELKLHLQTMEQQVNLQDALNESLREEMQHLKVMTSQAIQNGGAMNFLSSYGGGNQQFYNNNHAMQTLLTAQQLQQLQINQQSQQHQFQQQQQQQLQQQFQQQHSQQQQQLAADMKMRGSAAAPPSSMSQRENGSSSDLNNTSSNE